MEIRVGPIFNFWPCTNVRHPTVLTNPRLQLVNSCRHRDSHKELLRVVAAVAWQHIRGDVEVEVAFAYQ
jgi:hypothetical protein